MKLTFPATSSGFSRVLGKYMYMVDEWRITSNMNASV